MQGQCVGTAGPLVRHGRQRRLLVNAKALGHATRIVRGDTTPDGAAQKLVQRGNRGWGVDIGCQNCVKRVAQGPRLLGGRGGGLGLGHGPPQRRGHRRRRLGRQDQGRCLPIQAVARGVVAGIVHGCAALNGGTQDVLERRTPWMNGGPTTLNEEPVTSLHFFPCRLDSVSSSTVQSHPRYPSSRMSACVALLRAVTLSRVDEPPHRLTAATLTDACTRIGWQLFRNYASQSGRTRVKTNAGLVMSAQIMEGSPSTQSSKPI